MFCSFRQIFKEYISADFPIHGHHIQIHDDKPLGSKYFRNNSNLRNCDFNETRYITAQRRFPECVILGSSYVFTKILKERDHLEDLGIDGRVILERILEKLGGKAWTGFICLSSVQWRSLVNMKMSFGS
jgi:hypothetical protein